MRRIVVAALAALIGCGGAGCSGGDAGGKAGGPGKGPSPRRDDPKLTHSWQMPKEASAVMSGDLGTMPESVAAVLMEAGMPTVTHKSANDCRDKGSLKGADSIALRFEVGEDGKIAKVTGDPSGAAATCLAESFSKHASELDRLPAGDALLRVRFHPGA